MSQLVRDDQFQPVVEIGQFESLDGRRREDRDAIPGRDSGEAIACVGVVGDDDIDGAWRRLIELLNEADSGSCRIVGDAGG